MYGYYFRYGYVSYHDRKFFKLRDAIKETVKKHHNILGKIICVFGTTYAWLAFADGYTHAKRSANHV